MERIGATGTQQGLLEAEGGGAAEDGTEVPRILDAPGTHDAEGQRSDGFGAEFHEQGMLRRAARIRQFPHENLAQHLGFHAQGGLQRVRSGLFKAQPEGRVQALSGGGLLCFSPGFDELLAQQQGGVTPGATRLQPGLERPEARVGLAGEKGHGDGAFGTDRDFS